MHDPQLDLLVQKVQANPKYGSINRELIQRLSKDAIAMGLTGKSALKYVRKKCHQIGGAYFKRNMDYHTIQTDLSKLSDDINADEVKQFYLKTMGMHASTAERLPILSTFFETCLAPITPITSLIDLACGLNPMAIPWMPLEQDCTYVACDIYEDLLDFLQSFFIHFNLGGTTLSCDLTGNIPEMPAQVALILKSIPCLEQVDKQIGTRLLEGVQADHILVSFPVSSLGGRKKGMPEFYREHFYQMLSGKSWSVQEFLFSSELAFLVTK